MAKISKNIKQYRAALKMTQSDLAERINVSRQTISSWETDRTQPDVDMLESLASVFDVSIEEVIYGKRNRIGLEPEPRKDRNVFVIVLSVIGSLMTAAGLVIVFSYFWDKLETFKLAFSFIPLIAGFAFAMYAVSKKKNSIPWIEGAAVAWTVGLVVTNALADSMVDANFGYYMLLLIDVLVTLPIILITKALVPFLFCLYGASHSIIGLYYNEKFNNILILFALLLAVVATAVVFCRTYKCNDIRKKVMGHATAVTAMTNLTVVLCFIIDRICSNCNEIYAVLILLLGYALFAYNSYEKIPYFTPEVGSGLYLAVVSTINTVLILDNVPYSEKWYVYLLPMAVVIVMAISSFAANFSNMKHDIIRICIAGLSLVIDGLLLVSMTSNDENTTLTYITLFVALAMAVIIIVKGVKTSELFTANVGMIMACIIAWIVIIFSGFGLLEKGISCSLTGIVLLLADKKLISSIKKEEKAADEVADDD